VTLLVLLALGLVSYAGFRGLLRPPGTTDVPPEYVGVWQLQGDDLSVIQILPNGQASYRFKSGSGTASSSITGGRAYIDREKNQLHVKLFFFGPSWRIDRPPSRQGDQFEMRLNGKTFRKVEEYPRDRPRDGITI
jgi:hypothetical protein